MSSTQSPPGAPEAPDPFASATGQAIGLTAESATGVGYLGGPQTPAAPASPAGAGAAATTSATSHVADGSVDVADREHHWFPQPTKPVGPVFVALLVLAQLVFFVALLGPAIIAIAIKVAAIVPEDQKTSALGIVTSVGAIAAFAGNVVFGRLSDRTTSRFGRRRPWLVAGCVVMTAAFFVMATANSVAVLAAGWFLAQLGANATLAPYIATIADHVPVAQRARVSAWVGIAQNVGILGAVYLAQALTSHLVLLFVGPGVAAILAMTLYAVYLPDQHLSTRPPRMDLREWLKTFWVSPRQYPDYALAWWSRFLIVLGSFMFSTYRLFFLTDRINLSSSKAAGAVATGVLIYTVVLVLAGYLGGWLSDRTGRRKIFVACSTLLFGIGMAMLAHAHTVGQFYGVEAIMGLAFGVYMGVDLALVVDVLPSPDDAGKDLGVFNMANAIPQTLAPGVGAVLLALGSAAKQNYTLLFWGAAIACLAGAIIVLPIKKVR